MSRAESWEEAYLAVSVALGEPREVTLARLSDREARSVATLARTLEASTKVARAQALASALAEVARDVVAMGLR